MFDVLRNFWCYLNTSAIKAIKKNLLVFSIASLIAVKCIFDSAALKLSKSEIKKKKWNHCYRVSHPQLHVEKLSGKKIISFFLQTGCHQWLVSFQSAHPQLHPLAPTRLFPPPHPIKWPVSVFHRKVGACVSQSNDITAQLSDFIR